MVEISSHLRYVCMLTILLVLIIQYVVRELERDQLK